MATHSLANCIARVPVAVLPPLIKIGYDTASFPGQGVSSCWYIANATVLIPGIIISIFKHVSRHFLPMPKVEASSKLIWSGILVNTPSFATAYSVKQPSSWLLLMAPLVEARQSRRKVACQISSVHPSGNPVTNLHIRSNFRALGDVRDSFHCRTQIKQRTTSTTVPA